MAVVFVLGDFGSPDNIAVNSTHFYILDRAEDLLHVFETAPFTQIADNDGDQAVDSATIVYRSDNNYVGADNFTYRTSDGLLNDIGTIELNVSRNFRPPRADVGLTAVISEDLPIPITLSGYDLDEHLDTLTFPITQPPEHGTLSGSSPTYTYTPDPEFSGVDTFTFAADDGRFLSEPETVTITVLAINDAPELDMPAALTIGRGVTETFAFDFHDPDPDDHHLLVVDWGDGVVEQEGRLTSDGQMIGLLLLENGYSGGTIQAMHTYLASGEHDLTICITDNVIINSNGDKEPTVDSVPTCRTTQITVIPMADVTLDLRDTADPIVAGSSLGYELTIRNHPLAGGVPPQTATGLQFTHNLGPGLTYEGASVSNGAGTCQHREDIITCQLNPLAPGESVFIQVDASVDNGLASGTHVQAGANLTLDQPTVTDELLGAVTTTIVAPADFLVNDEGDDADAQPGDDNCATADGVCSLRAALDEANALPGQQTIALSDRTYQLDTATNQAIPITGDVTIIGLGITRTILTGNGGDRLLVIQEANVDLTAVTITGGNSDEYGGGLRNNGGTVTLDRVQFGDNEALHGGAIANIGGTIVIRESKINGNRAMGFGGGIFNGGALTLVDSNVMGNQAENGGGIRHQDEYDLTSVRSTVAQNEVIHSGGGLHVETTGTVTLSNSTVSGNLAADSGGGIFIDEGDLQAINVTIADNVVNDDDGDGISGGGVFIGDDAAMLLQNSILGQNVDHADMAPDCSGVVNSDGNNLLGNSTGCIWQAGPADIRDLDPMLYQLAENGGWTPTQALRGGSPAIETGLCLLPIDQRGVERPVDGDLDGISNCDIGAHEFERELYYLPVITR